MTSFDANAVDIDPEGESHRLQGLIKRDVTKRLRRRGAVVGISGGVDSSRTLAAAPCTPSTLWVADWVGTRNSPPRPNPPAV